ncbi:MAG: helix-turn-helix domain-containing protein [Bryobacteraceae bacterium]
MNNPILPGAATGDHRVDEPRVPLRLPAEASERLRFEPFWILDCVESSKRFRRPLDPSFPLAVKLYEFPPVPRAVPLTWHEHLEIFCPIGGRGTFRVGEHVERFEAGDILLIDNLRLHGVESFEGDRRHALVVVFSPELIATPLPCDQLLLRPFRHFRDGCLKLARGDPYSSQAWDCLDRMVLALMEQSDILSRQARQKLILCQLLLILGEAFRSRLDQIADYERRRNHLRRLQPLLDFLASNLAQPPNITQAARMLKMSNSYFMRFFRKATGLTFSAYLNQIRISRACQLLIESDLSLARIAAETGFCDQSHLCRHIRRRLGKSPGQVRAERQRAGDLAPRKATG